MRSKKIKEKIHACKVVMIPYIEASGSPWDIGHRIGLELRGNFQVLKGRFDDRIEKSMGNEAFRKKVGPLISFSEQHVPLCVEEIRGMAEGADVPFVSLFGMNAMQEIMFQPRGCSSLAVPQDGTQDGVVLLAHNEDNDHALSDHTYLIKGEPDEEPAFLAFAYGGFTLNQGFNDRGIGSVGNALYSNDLKPGIPKLLAYREIMRSTFIEDAIRRCIRPERANGNNHIIANEDGEIYDLEVSAMRYGLIYAGGSFLAHTNHFTKAGMLDLDGWADLLNSRIRLNRLNRMLEERFGRIDIETLKVILSDHVNYPKSICKHVEAGVNETVATIGSVIIDLTNRSLMATSGNPCKGTFVEIRLY